MFVTESIDKSGEDPVSAALKPLGVAEEETEESSKKNTAELFQKFFGNFSTNVNHSYLTKHETTTAEDNVSLIDHFLNVEHSYETYNETQTKVMMEEIFRSEQSLKEFFQNDTHSETENSTATKNNTEDVVTRFLRLIETQHLLGENCTAGTDLNLGVGVVDRYAQERFRIEADVAVNRANMLTRLWKYAGPSVMHNEYLLHASVFSMVEFDDDIFAAGNCYDQYQYKDYQLFCPFAYRLPEGPILAKDLAVEYKYLSNTSEWFYIARKNAERVIKNHSQFRRGEFENHF